MRGYKAPFESLPIYKTNNCLNEILKLIEKGCTTNKNNLMYTIFYTLQLECQTNLLETNILYEYLNKQQKCLSVSYMFLNVRHD